MATHEDYCTLEQSQLLKEMGFDWECHASYMKMSYQTEYRFYTFTGMADEYHHVVPAPTLAQVAKWFREVKEINIEVISCYKGSLETWEWDCFIHSLNDYDEIDDSTISHLTYEGALSAGLTKAIKIVKNEQ